MALRSYQNAGKVAGHKLSRGTLVRILRFGRPYRFELTVFLALTVASAAISVVTPLLFKVIIDDGVVPQARRVVVIGALAVAGLALLDAVVGLVQRWYSARIGEGLIYDLRSRVFGHVSAMPIAFFTRAQTGSLVSRLNSDVIGAQQAFTTTLSAVVSNVVSLVLVVATMAYLSWQITLVALLLLPVFVLPARWVGRKLQAIAQESMQLNAAMSQTMTERFNVSGALLVKVFGRPDEEQRDFSAKAARVRDIGVISAMYSRVFFTALTLIAALATALVYGIGGILAIDGALEVGTLVALSALLIRLYGPLTALSNVHVDVMTALVSFERVFEVLDLKPMVDDRPGARDLPADAPASVELEAVTFRYPAGSEVSLASLEAAGTHDSRTSADVLHEVSFRVEPGQLVALVGPSGAGKTTITALVSRLYDATSGMVRVGGVDVRDLTQRSLRAAIGVVTQDAHMFHDTLRANLLYARPGASDAELAEALRAAQVWDLVEALPDGLDTVVGDRGYRLSGGEKQRFAIARLLLKAPRVVVLDEATAHLDSESEAAVQRAFDTALAGRTSIVVAHRLSTVREADLILVVDGGRVRERGTHEELLAQGGLYAELYRTQFRLQDDAELSASG
ncbi:ABC transporter ATP-binding protein [Motilibacter aurantiacus]|uniref:ABC transporter ATP-binding protein n=1 Tax=Motilibacter aurantiacus TaxID=2714955 RepID=UPI00140C160C|nr:ABC transporter ATP-binding protein [Motilibacter aurantiacus]NHC45425.1 ABC transporter ATP-binding protein [Motilibacter aurantiacus]